MRQDLGCRSLVVWWTNSAVAQTQQGEDERPTTPSPPPSRKTRP